MKTAEEHEHDDRSQWVDCMQNSMERIGICELNTLGAHLKVGAVLRACVYDNDELEGGDSMKKKELPELGQNQERLHHRQRHERRTAPQRLNGRSKDTGSTKAVFVRTGNSTGSAQEAD